MLSRFNMPRRTRRRATAGVTLIELLVALGISGLVLSASSALLLQGFSNEAQYRQQNTAQQSARTAADTLGDDLRGAVNGAVSLGALTFASPLTCRIYADDGTERIVFWWRSGTTLRRLVAATTATGPASVNDGVAVASGISALTVSVSGKTASIDLTATSGTSTVQMKPNIGLRNLVIP
ncbi:MAG: prepilin-type N-terminal cleavage/methylation domain-containing protein [Armatimonadota bacterium]